MKNDPPPDLENLISIAEIIVTLPHAGGEIEVCATADAAYDSAAEKVSVALGSFARRLAGSGTGEHLPQRWLPPAEQVTEHLSRDEATAFAKDVFQSWVRKVRATIPHAA